MYYTTLLVLLHTSRRVVLAAVPLPTLAFYHIFNCFTPVFLFFVRGLFCAGRRDVIIIGVSKLAKVGPDDVKPYTMRTSLFISTARPDADATSWSMCLVSAASDPEDDTNLVLPDIGSLDHHHDLTWFGRSGQTVWICDVRIPRFFFSCLGILFPPRTSCHDVVKYLART